MIGPDTSFITSSDLGDAIQMRRLRRGTLVECICIATVQPCLAPGMQHVLAWDQLARACRGDFVACRPLFEHGQSARCLLGVITDHDTKGDGMCVVHILCWAIEHGWNPKAALRVGKLHVLPLPEPPLPHNNLPRRLSMAIGVELNKRRRCSLWNAGAVADAGEPRVRATSTKRDTDGQKCFRSAAGLCSMGSSSLSRHGDLLQRSAAADCIPTARRLISEARRYAVDVDWLLRRRFAAASAAFEGDNPPPRVGKVPDTGSAASTASAASHASKQRKQRRQKRRDPPSVSHPVQKRGFSHVWVRPGLASHVPPTAAARAAQPPAKRSAPSRSSKTLSKRAALDQDSFPARTEPAQFESLRNTHDAFALPHPSLAAPPRRDDSAALLALLLSGMPKIAPACHCLPLCPVLALRVLDVPLRARVSKRTPASAHRRTRLNAYSDIVVDPGDACGHGEAATASFYHARLDTMIRPLRVPSFPGPLLYGSNNELRTDALIVCQANPGLTIPSASASPHLSWFPHTAWALLIEPRPGGGNIVCLGFRYYDVAGIVACIVACHPHVLTREVTLPAWLTPARAKAELAVLTEDWEDPEQSQSFQAVSNCIRDYLLFHAAEKRMRFSKSDSADATAVTTFAELVLHVPTVGLMQESGMIPSSMSAGQQAVVASTVRSWVERKGMVVFDALLAANSRLERVPQRPRSPDMRWLVPQLLQVHELYKHNESHAIAQFFHSLKRYAASGTFATGSFSHPPASTTVASRAVAVALAGVPVRQGYQSMMKSVTLMTMTAFAAYTRDQASPAASLFGTDDLFAFVRRQEEALAFVMNLAK